MSIPQVREILNQIRTRVTLIGRPDLVHLCDKAIVLSFRDRNPRRPRSSPETTPALRRTYRQYAKDHPEMTLHDVAAHFKTNPGRIYEAIYGDN